MEYTLVKASPADYDVFYRLRCEEKNIAWSGHTAKPDYDGFRKWYDRQMESDTRTIYLFMKDNEAVGYLYSVREREGVIELGYGISSHHEGKGLATRMLRCFIASAPPIVLLKAYISVLNVGSQHVVTKLGFHKTLVHDYRMLPLLASEPSKFDCWELFLE